MSAGVLEAPNLTSVQPSLFLEEPAATDTASVRLILAAARARSKGPQGPTHHPCPAPGCSFHVPMKRLACSAYWHALPADLRAAINDTYRRDRRRHLELYREAVRLLHTITREDHP